jgi:hypothetical protein
MDRGYLAEEIETLARSTRRPPDQLAADDPARPPRARQTAPKIPRPAAPPSALPATAYRHAREDASDETALPPGHLPGGLPVDAGPGAGRGLLAGEPAMWLL